MFCVKVEIYEGPVPPGFCCTQLVTSMETKPTYREVLQKTEVSSFTPRDKAETKEDQFSEEQRVTFKVGNPNIEESLGYLHLYKEKETTIPSKRARLPVSSLLRGLVGCEFDFFSPPSPLFTASLYAIDEARRTSCSLGSTFLVICLRLLPFCGPVSETYQSYAHPAVLVWIFPFKTITVKIRDCKATDRYMVIMQFREQTKADEFYLQFEGKKFNSLEVSNLQCKVVHSPTHSCTLTHP